MHDPSGALPPRPSPELEKLLVDGIRVLSMDAIQHANSGHPGAPMGLAPAGYLLWTRYLRHDPDDPTWPDRDRFVLSLGHASMLLYSLLYLTGYEMELDDLKDFRQWGSRTPGHPERDLARGVETTTGPLGQGVANSVGMALAERWLAHRFNRPGHSLVDHFTWAFCSDGDLMEGISHEAAEFAGHQRLGKLIWVYDDNRITIEGPTRLATSTDIRLRFESYGWGVLEVDDGNDLDALDRAFQEARSDLSRPTLVVVRTTIAYGSPHKAGTAASHGSPLGEEEVRATKENLGYPSLEPFWVDPEALAWCREHCGRRGREQHEAWLRRVRRYEAAFPEMGRTFHDWINNFLEPGWDEGLPDLTDVREPEPTRTSSGRVIQHIAARLGNLVGGSADLGPSNKTDIRDGGDLLPERPDGRILHFGVREHAMGGILNGIALHGGLRPFGGTFLVFSDYMRPAVRLAALMDLPVIFVFTHDSIGLGEDGPTHQPVEQLMALRTMPNLMDIRPADAAETAVAWRVAVNRVGGPSFLSLTRQAVPQIDREGEGLAPADGLERGAYILAEATGEKPELVLMGNGSELHLALEARKRMEEEGVPTRVVSFPSWFLFARQPRKYRDQVLPPDLHARVSVEAGIPLGWERWVGPLGEAAGVDRFGASAPGPVLYEQFGLTVEGVVRRARRTLERTRKEKKDEK